MFRSVSTSCSSGIVWILSTREAGLSEEVLQQPRSPRQLLVGPHLHHFARVHDHDPLVEAGQVESLDDRDDGTALHHLEETLVHLHALVRLEWPEGAIQDQDRWPLQEGAGEE